MGNCLTPKAKSKEEVMSVLKSKYPERVESTIALKKAEQMSKTECMHGAQPAVARKKNATKEIRRLYKVNDHLLGSGSFGKVYLG